MLSVLSVVLFSGPVLAYAGDSTFLRCTNVFNEGLIQPGNAVPSRWNVTVSPCTIGFSSEGMFSVTVTPYQAQQKLPDYSSVVAWVISPSNITLGDIPVGTGQLAEFSVSVPASTQAGVYAQQFSVNYTDATGFPRRETQSGSVHISTITNVSSLSLALGLLPKAGEPELLAATLTTAEGVPVSNALVHVCGDNPSGRGPQWLTITYLATSDGIATLPLKETGPHRTAAVMYSNSTQECESLLVIGKASNYIAASIAIPAPKFPLIPMVTIMLPALLLQGLGALAVQRKIPLPPLYLRRLSPIMPTVLGLIGGGAGIVMLLLVQPYPIPERPFACIDCIPAPVTMAALGSAMCISGAMVALFLRRAGALLLLSGGIVPVCGAALGEPIYATGYGWYLLWTLIPIFGGLFGLTSFLARRFRSVGDRGPKYLGMIAGLWGLIGFPILLFGLFMGAAFGSVPRFAFAYAVSWLGCSLAALFAGWLTRTSMRAATLALIAAFYVMLAALVSFWYEVAAMVGVLPRFYIGNYFVFSLWYGWIPLILVAGMLGLARWPRTRH